MSTSRGHIGPHRSNEEKTKSVKLFIGQISSTVDEGALTALLSKYAPILRVKILYDRKSKLPKHCAFIYVESINVANVLIQSLDKKFTFDDMRSPVNIAIANEKKRGNDMKAKKTDTRNGKSAVIQKGRKKTQSTPDSANSEWVGELLQHTDEIYDRRKYTTHSPENEIVRVSSQNYHSQTADPMIHPISHRISSSEEACESNHHQSETRSPEEPKPTISISQPYNDGNTNNSHETNSVSSLTHSISFSSPVNTPSSITPEAPPSEITLPPTYVIPPSYYYPNISYPPIPIPIPSTNTTPTTTSTQTTDQSTFPTMNTSSPAIPFPGIIPVSPAGMYYPVMFADSIYPMPVVIPQQVAPVNGIKTVSDVSGFHHEGPAGANVFVYHIPTTMDDQGLYDLFSPFGTILSTKVYLDKVTHESRGFGFVSFSTVIEAENAINQMNGHLVEGKHLKVQKKKEKIIHQLPYPMYPYSG